MVPYPGDIWGVTWPSRPDTLELQFSLLISIRNNKNCPAAISYTHRLVLHPDQPMSSRPMPAKAGGEPGPITTGGDYGSPLSRGRPDGEMRGARVSRAQRSTKWCAADPGSFQSVAVPDQRCTASLPLALHRIRDTG
jgi:hypothetical protein